MAKVRRSVDDADLSKSGGGMGSSKIWITALYFAVHGKRYWMSKVTTNYVF